MGEEKTFTYGRIMGIIGSKDDPKHRYNAACATGLYKTTSWPPGVVKKIVISKKIAPFFPPATESSEDPTIEECPLCMMYYPGGLNRALCCRKGICSECFVQVQNPPGSNTLKDCPFCLSAEFNVEYKGPKSAEEIAKEKAEQDKVEKLHRAVRDEEIRRDSLRVLQTKAKSRAEEMFVIDEVIKDDGKEEEEHEEVVVESHEPPLFVDTNYENPVDDGLCFVCVVLFP